MKEVVTSTTLTGHLVYWLLKWLSMVDRQILHPLETSTPSKKIDRRREATTVGMVEWEVLLEEHAACNALGVCPVDPLL